MCLSCARSFGLRCRAFIFLVTDLLHPVDHFAVERFLNGYVCHGSAGCGAMPVLFSGPTGDDVSRSYRDNRPAPALCQSNPCSHDQGLSKRMRVPRAARPRLEGDARTTRPSGLGRFDSGSIRTEPEKYSAGPFSEGCVPLLLICMSVSN